MKKLILLILISLLCVCCYFSGYSFGKTSIEEEIESLEQDNKEFLSKHYWAQIITKEHFMYRKRNDKYQVLLIDIPNINEFDPNVNDWMIIDRFSICFDEECVKVGMDCIKIWDSEPIWPKLKWSWIN